MGGYDIPEGDLLYLVVKARMFPIQFFFSLQLGNEAEIQCHQLRYC